VYSKQPWFVDGLTILDCVIIVALLLWLLMVVAISELDLSSIS
jgi:hypothetical protein